MRGSDAVTGAMFSYVDIEARVPAKHPIRVIRRIVNEVLERLGADFAAMSSSIGRPSMAPEKLLRTSLLQAFFTVRSERLLMERLDYDLMFRWFVGLGIDDPVWDHSTFSKNRDRLLEADIARKFLKCILEHKEVAPLLSDEHFTVDGTLVTAWASLKSFVPKENAGATGARPPDDYGQGRPPASGTKPKAEAAEQATSTESSKSESAAPMPIAAETDKRSRNEEVNFHGQKRCNDTHVSTSDPEARLFRKGPGKEARLSYMGHAMTENRHGLVVKTGFTQATGTAEREEAKAMIGRHSPGSTRRACARGPRPPRPPPPPAAPPIPGPCASPRTPPKKPRARRLMPAPRAIPATPSPSGGASWSRSHSAGPRPSAASRVSSSRASPARASPSPSSWPPMTWCACRG